MKKLIYILLIVLLFSCRTSSLIQKTDKSLVKSDSTAYSYIMKVDTVTIPADTLRVEIPITVFERDTIIQYKNGRASTRIIYRDGKIRLDTKCDSLSKLVLSYEERLFRSEKEREKLISSSKEKIVKKIPFYYRWSLWVSIVSVLYIALSLFFRKFKIVKK